MANTSPTDLPLTLESTGEPATLPPQASGISLALQETSGSPARRMDCDGRPDAHGGARPVKRSASVSDSVSDSISDSVSEYGSPLAEVTAVKTAAENPDSACSSPSKLSNYHTPPQSPPLAPSSPSRLTKSSSTLDGCPGTNDEQRVESGIRRHAGHTLSVQHPQQQQQQHPQQTSSGEGSGEPSGERCEERSGERFRRRSADCSSDCFVDSPLGSPTDRSAAYFADRSAERSVERVGKRTGGPNPGMGGLGPGMSARSRRHSADVVNGGRGGRRDGDVAGKGGRGVGGGETAAGGGEEGGEGDEGEEQQGQGNGRVAQIAEGLLWVQKHPVLSAVIWMFGKVLDPRGDGAEGQDGGEGASEPNGDGKGGLYARSSGNNGDGARGALRGDGGGDGSPFRGRGGAGEALVSGGSSGDFERARGAPRFFWRRHSKGRLSWSDDYGGCLAEYYEDQRVRSVSDTSSVPPSESPATASAGGGGGGSDSHSEDASHAAASAALASLAGEEPAAGRSWDSPDDGGGGGGRVKVCASPYPEVNSGIFPEGLRVEGSVARRGDGKECVGEQRGNAGGAEEGGCGAACGSLVHNGTSYGGMQEAMLGQRWMNGEGNAVDCQDGQALSGQRGTMPPPKPVAVDDGGVFLPHPRPQSGEGGIGAAVGMPPGSGAGTWSPQWGWYVSMTPPQDMYPTAQGTGPAVKAAASPSGPSEAPSSLKGRPPRP